ncbi:MAG: Trp family transcriptional regulator [Patescibacteria group bacterium]
MIKKYMSELISTFCKIRSTQEMEDFLHGILTPQECDEISTRLQVVKMLQKGIPQHKIAKNLGVGVATVTRGSKELGKGRFAYISSKSWRTSKKGG